MAIKKFIYPLDLRGELSSNLLSENHVIGTDKYRAFALSNGPFYADSVTLKERNSNKVLKRGDDYECVFLYDDITALTPGLEVTGVIVVHNTKVSTDVTVTAQFVGGPFANSGAAIEKAIEDLEIGNKNAYWENIIDKPELFQPTPHLHDFADIYGFEFIIDVLGNIRDTLMVGGNAQVEKINDRVDEIDRSIRAMIDDHTDDTNNPHKVSATQLGVYTKAQVNSIAANIRGEIDDLGPEFNLIKSDIDNNTDLINSLSASLQTLSTTQNTDRANANRAITLVGTVNSDITALKKDVSDLGDRIDGLSSRIDNVQSEVSTNTSNIAKNKTEISKNASAISTLDERLTSASSKNTNDITSLKSRVTTNENNISQLSSTANNAVSWDDVNKTTTGWSAVINKLPYVDGSGVTRIGKYLTFTESGSTENYTSRLHSANGVLTASGNMSVNDIYIRSDRRFKENIRQIKPSEVSSILMAIGKSYRYTLKDDASKQVSVGLIAQEVEKVFPEAVRATVEDDGSERLRVLPYALVSLLVAGYCDQEKRIRKQENIINALCKRLDISIDEV